MKNKSLKTFLAILFVLLFLLGLALIIAPFVIRKNQDVKIQQTLDGWKTEFQPEVPDETVPEETKEMVFPELFQAMVAYNQKIYLEGQAELVDAWSYQKETIHLTDYNVEDNAVGYITIPAIDVELPLYLGASYENLSLGFAQLSQTSMPIGGNNTNCVVACHRGWRGSAYLRDADKLTEGDSVILQNLWETLTYAVCEIEVIEPYEISKVLIQPNRDLLTIVTCTPYGVGSQRLILYCERVPSNTQ